MKVPSGIVRQRKRFGEIYVHIAIKWMLESVANLYPADSRRSKQMIYRNPQEYFWGKLGEGFKLFV